MKLLLKNLKQQEFNIEIESDQKTVKDLKLEIEKVYNFDSTRIKLLHSGVVLEDAKTLEEYKIKEGNVIIMMLAKAKQAPPKPESNPIPQPPLQPKEQPKSNENKPEYKPQPQPQEYTEQINSLVDMGYERDKVEKAIKAANGSIDLAVEFLNSGSIPEPSQGSSNNTGNANVNPNLPLELKRNASIIKCLCLNNPEKLPNILNNLKQHSPQLIELIKQHEEDFKNLLVAPLSQEDINNFQGLQQELRRPQGPTIRLTKEESDAVKRLQELGFSQADAVQAYFACDKNEEMAANFLFEQKMRDDEEANNQNQNNQNQGQGQGQG